MALIEKTPFPEVEVRLRCSGHIHTIRLLPSGELCLLDHDASSRASEEALTVMGGEPCRCHAVMAAWRTMVHYPLPAFDKRGTMHARKLGLPRALLAGARRAAYRHRKRSSTRRWLHQGVEELYDHQAIRIDRARSLVTWALNDSTYASGRSRRFHVYTAEDREGTRVKGRVLKQLDNPDRSYFSARAYIHPPSVILARHRLGTLIACSGRSRVVVLRIIEQLGPECFHVLSCLQSGDPRDYWRNRVSLTECEAIIRRGTRTRHGQKLPCWRVTRWL